MQSSTAYLHLTDDALADFAGIGSQQIIEKLQLKDVPRDEANDTASEIFTELLMCFEEGKISTESIVEFLSHAINDEEKATIFCQALDVFPVSESIKNLMGVLSEKKSVIQPKTIAENVDSALLTTSNFVPAQSLQRQLNTRKRDKFYTQNKFNLFYEEFEGYAKLIQELYKILKTPRNLGLVGFAVRAIESLIGHYQLDPNRVLDVIFDIFGQVIVSNQEFMIRFLKQSRWWPAVEATPEAGLQGLNHGGSETGSKSLALKFIKASEDRAFSETFKIMIALLIKEGFISFGSLFVYLRPDSEGMAELEKLYKKELDEKVFKSTASALALAAPLAAEEDEGAEGAKTQTDVHKKTDVSVKKRLEHNLKYQMLKIFLEVGLYWPSVYILTEYPFLVHVDDEVPQLILRMLEKMIQPLHTELCAPPASLIQALSTPQATPRPYSMGSIKYSTATPSSIYSFKPNAHLHSSKNIVYFYKEWSDRLPRVQSFEDLQKVSEELVKFLGPALSKDLAVFSKLCELLTSLCDSESEPEARQSYLNYFRNYILPAIGQIEENPVPVAKAFNFLKLFSSDERFNLYGELYQVSAKNNLHVKICVGKAEKATKDALKRLSKENVKPMMRKLAKISYSNPLPCFLTILQQIESYDNLNSLVVETAQYFNEYGWDNLTLAILMRITALGRSNIQQDGLHERQWIQSLASFVGQVCHKYPESVDLKSLVVYLIKSFHLRESSGLLVFKEILALVGGIKPINNLTPLQVDMINSGHSLEKIVYKTIDDQRYESNEAGSKLAEVLLDLDVVNEIFVLLSNLNKALITDDENTHLKVLASRADDINDVMHLFCTLIGFFGSDQIPGNLEAITTLVGKYGVTIPWAFELWRPYLTDTEVLGDIGEDFSGEVNSALFTSFWSLRLYDINFSDALYDTELSKLESNVTSLKESLLLARRSKDTTLARLQQLKTDYLRTEDFKSKIPAEKESHKIHNDEVTKALSEPSLSWFSSRTDEDREGEVKAFLQRCVFPRSLQSSFDAVFSARFLFKLQDMRNDCFSILTATRYIFHSRIIFATLFTCTPSEAESLGLFYAEVLRTLYSWHNEEDYLKQFQERPLKRSNFTQDVTNSEFRKTLFEIHSSLLADVSRALEAEEYMCRRNAITLMKNLLGVYPIVEDHCESIVALIENIIATEDREDLKLSSSALIGHLKSRSKAWVHMWEFYDMAEEDKEKQMLYRKGIEEEAEKRRIALQQEREALEKKAKEEEERVLAEKRKQAEEEEKRRRLEREKAEQEEKAEQQKQASARALKYDEEGKAPIRQDRVKEAPRGRYDQYSRATPRPETPVGPSEKKEATPQNARPGPKDDKKGETDNTNKPLSKETGNGDDLFKGRVTKPSEAPATSTKKEEPPSRPKEPARLQENARTRFANQRLPSPSEARGRNDARSRNDSRQNADSKSRNDPRHGTDTKSRNDSRHGGDSKSRNDSRHGGDARSRNDSRPHSDAKAREPPLPPPPAPQQKRDPLPPQTAPKNPRFNSHSNREDNRRDNLQSKPRGGPAGSRGDSRSTTPLPPPPTPPPNASNYRRNDSDRGDRKREWRGSHNNRSDKRSRY